MPQSLSSPPLAALPAILTVLQVSVTQDDWLECLLAEHPTTPVKIEDADLASAMTRLREQNFDCVILRHEPPSLDAAATLPSMRTVFPHQPIVVVSDRPARTFVSACLAADADQCIDDCHQVDSQALMSIVWRAIERQRLLVESAGLHSSMQSQQRQHQQAVLHQLRAQKSLLLECNTDAHPPTWLKDQFLELLKVYVVSGRGNPRDELGHLLHTLKKCHVTLTEALLAHAFATEELVLSLGQRPAWHVVSRSNLMAYELVLQLGAPLQAEVSDELHPKVAR